MIIVIIITIYCNTRTLSHILTLALAHLHICYDADYTIRISHSEWFVSKTQSWRLFFFLIGKIRVKIVTSKDALENMDGKNDLKLLSEREETQFRDMILGLLVSVGYKGVHQTVMSCSGCAFIVRSPS